MFLPQARQAPRTRFLVAGIREARPLVAHPQPPRVSQRSPQQRREYPRLRTPRSNLGRGRDLPTEDYISHRPLLLAAFRLSSWCRLGEVSWSRALRKWARGRRGGGAGLCVNRVVLTCGICDADWASGTLRRPFPFRLRAVHIPRPRMAPC